MSNKTTSLTCTTSTAYACETAEAKRNASDNRSKLVKFFLGSKKFKVVLPKKEDITNAKVMNIDDFIDTIMPNLIDFRVLFENRLVPNLVTVMYDANSDGSNTCALVTGNEDMVVIKSFKEAVRKAGGNVTSPLRISLKWKNYDDLDLHVREPNYHIYFSNRVSSETQGNLDVDMNASNHRLQRNAVENIVYPNLSWMAPGIYKVYINMFNKREHNNIGFAVEIDYKGDSIFYEYPNDFSGNVHIANIVKNSDGSIDIVDVLPRTNATLLRGSHMIWGISTSHFHEVQRMLVTEDKEGKRHFMFAIKGCCKEGESPNNLHGISLDEDSPNTLVVLANNDVYKVSI